MKRAFLFPGQGAQYVGMGRDFFDSFLVARETFQEADDLLGQHLSRLIFEGPEELLTQTSQAQLAIFVTSMAILRTVEEQLPRLIPSASAGLSLGEYTALCASHRLDFSSTLLLVRERARLMNEACEATSGAMAAVLGLSAQGVEEALKGMEGVWIANYNAPGQTVISGTEKGVERATLALKERGAKRVLPLTVHGAFHSPLMRSAEIGLAPFVEPLSIAPSEIGFVMNVTGEFASSEGEIKRNLIDQVTQSVRWEQGIQALKGAGIDLFLEIGCGKTLTGLSKKMGILACSAIEKVADLECVHAAS